MARFVCAVTIILLLAAAGCVSTIPPSPPGPAGTPAPAVSGTADLTNRYSDQAAVFRGGSSRTVLAPGSITVGLESIARGLAAPMMIAGDGSGRLFVADQTGTVLIIAENGSVLPDPFMDLRDRMATPKSGYDESGLFSIAFHPGYRGNGRVFVFYSAPLRQGAPAGYYCTNRLSEFRVMTGNPDRVDMGSEKVILEIDKPQMNHNGGQILFGPGDGYLYLPLGDGGGADDTGAGHAPGTGNAQDPSTLLGKLVRIDVDSPGTGGKAYAIPPDNPFISVPGYLPEIYATGLRNPAYLSVDTGGNHTLFAGVAGQQLFESVYIIARGGNYGWNIREGTHCFRPGSSAAPPAEPCPVTGARGEPIIGPVIENGHDLGNTMVGGYLYRNTVVPALTGRYVFGVWSTGFVTGDGSIYAATPPAGYDVSTYPASAAMITPADNRMWTIQEVRIAGRPDGRLHAYVRGFGRDDTGGLYLLTSTQAGPDPLAKGGEVWKIVPAP